MKQTLGTDHFPRVVGSLSSFSDSPPDERECDLLELRLDLLEPGEDVSDALLNARFPLLVTARDKNEGGANALSQAERLRRLQLYCNRADYLDVELANWTNYQALWEQGENQHLTTIASYHNFESTPEYSVLEEKLLAAQQLGADIVKFAFMTHRFEDLLVGQRLLFDYPKRPIAIMGMGAWGPLSRLFFAQCGSVLNYGYLGKTQTAPGQWPARLLKEALRHTPALQH